MTENAIKSEYFISVSSFADLDLATFQSSSVATALKLL